ncbi:DOPA 4,5-dioxygenase family protein [uncultured Sneathiella sp.]|uniref:DOPA 4,5-dioxygenase family protein n=1 Tax=uncultured Sneathiella sp. TaxID=879315 RepID=UPI0030EE8597|tara:strand:+ start:16651 stop:17001 length:351 start_codon:yes stop_codon:yes gene_type:complete
MPQNAKQAIRGYHAHVYYNPGNKDVAAVVREQLDEHFDVILGRWHDNAVGPHPISMYQVIFSTEDFSEIVPWLMLNRQGLDILIHPETGDDLADHRDNALWLGEKLELNLGMFERT